VTASVSAGNGTINPSGSVLVLPGSSQVFSLSPATGFHVADVLVNGVSKGAVGSLILPPVTANATVTASFAVNTYTVTRNAGANGAITGPTTVNHGDGAVYVITPNAGFHVVDVTVDGVSKGAVTSVTLAPAAADATVAATFAVNTYTITRNAGANGAITGPATANHGDTPVYTVTPNNGYHVADVTVNGVSKGALTSVTLPAVTANVTVAATFAVDVKVVIPTGDANNDGKVDIADALKALRVVIGLETIDSAQYLQCDVAPLDAAGKPAPDKQITVADALIILRKVVGLTSGW